MPTDVKLPRLGQGMESGTIVRWLKSEGDTVKKSEPLYELDTDKVTQEVESDLDGVLLKIVVQEGEVEVGTTIAVIENGDAADAASPDGASEPALSSRSPARQRRARQRDRRRAAAPADGSPDATDRHTYSAGRQGRRLGSRPRPSRAGSRASEAST